MSISRRTVIQGLAALGTVPVVGSMSRVVSAQEQPATGMTTTTNNAEGYMAQQDTTWTSR